MSVVLIQEVVILFDYGNVDACHQENIIHIQSFKRSSGKNYNNILERDVSTIEENQRGLEIIFNGIIVNDPFLVNIKNEYFFS